MFVQESLQKLLIWGKLVGFDTGINLSTPLHKVTTFFDLSEGPLKYQQSKHQEI